MTALVGTVLGAGGYWTYVFVLPELSERAPSVADQSSGSVLAGFFVTFLIMGLGWLLFAVASMRTGVFPAWAVGLLMVGALVTIVPLPSRTLLLSLAVACLGYLARQPVPSQHSAPKPTGWLGHRLKGWATDLSVRAGVENAHNSAVDTPCLSGHHCDMPQAGGSCSTHDHVAKASLCLE